MIEHLRDGWPQHYILVGRTPMAVDMMTWARWLQNAQDRVVAKTKITDRCHVSTVFLGLDHNWHKNDPVLFETLVFGGPLDGDMLRYTTYDEAEKGHDAMVKLAREACERIGAIWNAAHKPRPSKGWRRHVRKMKAGIR